MDALRMVAKLARKGDLEGIQKFLGEEQYVSEAVRNGFYDADNETGRDRQPPLTYDPIEVIADHQRVHGCYGVRPPAPKRQAA